MLGESVAAFATSAKEQRWGFTVNSVAIAAPLFRYSVQKSSAFTSFPVSLRSASTSAFRVMPRVFTSSSLHIRDNVSLFNPLAFRTSSWLTPFASINLPNLLRFLPSPNILYSPTILRFLALWTSLAKFIRIIRNNGRAGPRILYTIKRFTHVLRRRCP